MGTQVLPGLVARRNESNATKRLLGVKSCFTLRTPTVATPDEAPPPRRTAQRAASAATSSRNCAGVPAVS